MEKSVSQSQSQTPTLSLSPRLKRRRRRTAIETLLRTERKRERKEGKKRVNSSKFALSFVLLLASSSASFTLDGMRYERIGNEISFPNAREATITRRRTRTRTLKKNEAQRKETNTLARQNDITYRRAQGKLVLPDRVLRADFDLQQPLFP